MNISKTPVLEFLQRNASFSRGLPQKHVEKGVIPGSRLPMRTSGTGKNHPPGDGRSNCPPRPPDDVPRTFWQQVADETHRIVQENLRRQRNRIAG